MMQVGIAIGTFLTLAFFLSWYFEIRRSQMKLSRFESRESRYPKEIVSEFFGEDHIFHEQLVYWWEKAAKILKLDASKLRPEDRFDRELAPVKGFITEDESEELNDLVDDLSLNGANQNLKTYGDFVHFIATNSKEDV